VQLRAYEAIYERIDVDMIVLRRCGSFLEVFGNTIYESFSVMET